MFRWKLPKKATIDQLVFRPGTSDLVGLYRYTQGNNKNVQVAAWSVTGEPVPIPRCVESFSYSKRNNFINFSADGSLVGLTSASDTQARVFDWSGDNVVAEVAISQGRWDFGFVQFSPSVAPRLKWVVAGADQLQARNLATGEILADFDDGIYSAAAFNPTGEEFFVIDGNYLKGYKFKPFNMTLDFPLGTGSVYLDLQYSPVDSGRFIVRASNQGLLCYRRNGSPAWLVTLLHPLGRSHQILLKPGGTQFGLIDRDLLSILDVLTGQTVKEYDWSAGRLTALAFSPDGTLGAIGSDTGEIVVFDLD